MEASFPEQISLLKTCSCLHRPEKFTPARGWQDHTLKDVTKVSQQEGQVAWTWIPGPESRMVGGRGRNYMAGGGKLIAVGLAKAPDIFFSCWWNPGSYYDSH